MDKTYKVIRNSDNKLMGYIVGRTTDKQGNRYLIVQSSADWASRRLMAVDDLEANEYRVDVTQVSA